MNSNKMSFPLRHKFTGLSLSSLQIILLPVWENPFLKWEWWGHYVSNRLFKRLFSACMAGIFSSLNCHSISIHQFPFICEALAKYTYFKYLLLHPKVKSLLPNLAFVDPDPKTTTFLLREKLSSIQLKRNYEACNLENSEASREGIHYITSSEQ